MAARSAALAAVAMLLAAAWPACATPAPAAGQSSAAEAAETEAPSEPAQAPPAPVSLATGPLRPNIPVLPDLQLAPDFAPIPIGGWRITGRPGRGEADHGARMAIETIGRFLAEQTTGRVTVVAQVSAPADDPSVARRTSLARAIMLKGALTGGGLPGTRIDIRPMGRTPEGLDALDIVAPPAPPPRDTPPPPAPEPPPIPPPPPAPPPRASAGGAQPRTATPLPRRNAQGSTNQGGGQTP